MDDVPFYMSEQDVPVMERLYPDQMGRVRSWLKRLRTAAGLRKWSQLHSAAQADWNALHRLYECVKGHPVSLAKAAVATADR